MFFIKDKILQTINENWVWSYTIINFYRHFLVLFNIRIKIKASMITI